MTNLRRDKTLGRPTATESSALLINDANANGWKVGEHRTVS